MIFDDERREAAQSLKHYAHDQLQGGLLNTLKLATGIDGTWRDVLLRLADLIEPSEPEGTCGNCSHFIKDRFMPCDAAHGHTEADVGACEDFSPLSCDRDALLEIAQAMDSRGKCASEENGGDGEVDAWWLRQYAHLIRETLGVDNGW